MKDIIHITKDNRTFIVRTPIESDAEAIIAYSKTMFASTEQTLTTLEEYTVTKEGEEAWIRNFTQSQNAMAFVAVLDSEIVGLLFFAAQSKKKNAHTGEFGVSVHPEYQKLGIARVLIETLLTWASNHNEIEKVFLLVFATNTHAIRLYKEIGFCEEGRFAEAIKQRDGKYVDVIQMYKFVR